MELSFSKPLYPLDAVYGAAYIFIDRCYALLDEPSEGLFRVTLALKNGEPAEHTLSSLANEFAREIQSCALRAEIAKETAELIEAATNTALLGAVGPPTLDDLEKFDFSGEALEDPLGIAMSWEEKHATKKDPAP